MSDVQGYRSGKLIILILLALFSLRIIHLDLDSPTYSLLQYTRVDEGHYAMQALKNIMQDDMELVAQADGGLYETWNSSASYINTVLCTLTLGLFGRNYYGLRLAALIAGLLSYVFVLGIIRGEGEKKGQGFGQALLVAGGGMLLNFPYLIACRFNDPGIFRILTITATLFYVWKSCKKSGEPEYFGLGILSALCVVWGYATNIFVFVPAFILLLLEIRESRLSDSGMEGKKAVRKKIGKMGAGVIIGYLGGEGVLYLTQGTTFATTFFRINQTMGESRISFHPDELVNNILQLCMGNIFSYNCLFMFLSVVSVLYVLFSGHKKKESFRIYLAWMSIGFAAQSIFTNDTLIRKSIVIYSVLMLTVACFWTDFIHDRNRFEDALKGKKKIVCLVAAVFGCLWFYIARRRLGLIEEIDLTDAQKGVVIGLNVVAFCLGLLVIRAKRWKAGVVSIFLLIAMTLPDTFFTFQYFKTAGYEDKEIMTQMQDVIGNNFVLGGYPYGYCLYNDIIPASSTYDKFLPKEREARAKKLLQSDRKIYFLGNDEKELIDSWLEDEDAQWVLIKVFEETMRDYGGRTKLYLYERRK